MQVYNNQKYYEIAFSFRYISKEVDFIEQVIAKESRIPDLYSMMKVMSNDRCIRRLESFVLDNKSE